MLSISASAVPFLRALVEGEDRGAGIREGQTEGTRRESEGGGEDGRREDIRGLRVFVEKGGCAGLQYGMKVDGWQEGDRISEKEGARVLVDAQSAPFLNGAELDYCDDLTGTGFRIVNPNAARSCGCGTSFEPVQSSETGSESAQS
jgi:iron-sulfur cluster assembly accessory protein